MEKNNKKRYKINKKLSISGAILIITGLFSYLWINYSIRQDNISLKIIRLDQILFQQSSPEDIRHCLKPYPLFRKNFLQCHTHNQKQIIHLLHTMIEDENIQKLYKEVQKTYKNTDILAQHLTQALQKIQITYPHFKMPTVMTFMTGMAQDFYIDEQIMVIGLDFFLGTKGSYRPSLPKYLLRQYTPETLIVYVLKQIAQHFFLPAQKPTTYLLEDMIHHGKVYHFVKTVFPQVKEYALMGYTPQQMTLVKNSAQELWRYFIGQALFYNTQPDTKRPYITEGPFTLPISQECPGKIGHWIGFQIVHHYAKFHKKNLKQIMQHADAQEMLENAHYHP